MQGIRNSFRKLSTTKERKGEVVSNVVSFQPLAN